MLALFCRNLRVTSALIVLTLLAVGCVGADQWQDVTVEKGLVFFPASGGPECGWYMLDTGSPFWIFDAKAFKWSQAVQKDGRTKYSFDADGNQLPIKPFSMQDVTSIKKNDLTAMEERMGLRVIAVAGEPAFLSHVVQIDYTNHRIREIPRKEMAGEDLGEKWLISEKEGVITTDLKINNNDKCKVIVDTGATDFIRIDPTEKSKFGWRDGIPEEKSKLATVYGVLSGMSFKPDHLDINGAKFQNPRIDVNVDPDQKLTGNSIGAGFFSSYILTIDVANGAMYLKAAAVLKPGPAKSQPATAATH